MDFSIWKNIGTLSSYTENNSMKEMLKGKWYKYQSDFVRITILKDLCLITSSIATASVSLNIELPEHDAFYIQVNSSNVMSNVLIAANAALVLTVSAGQSIFASFNYK